MARQGARAGRAWSRAGAIVLALAGTCLCSVAAAQTYTVARSFDLVRRASDNAPLQNVYWVSLMLFPDIPDGADTSSPLPNKCVGDPDGPPAGDGVINSDDLICEWWSARQDPATAGTFSLTRLDGRTCTSVTRVATVALGGVRFTGLPFSVEQGEGFEVRISVRAGSPHSPRNPVTLSGQPTSPTLAIPSRTRDSAGPQRRCCSCCPCPTTPSTRPPTRSSVDSREWTGWMPMETASRTRARAACGRAGPSPCPASSTMSRSTRQLRASFQYHSDSDGIPA